MCYDVFYTSMLEGIFSQISHCYYLGCLKISTVGTANKLYRWHLLFRIFVLKSSANSTKILFIYIEVCKNFHSVHFKNRWKMPNVRKLLNWNKRIMIIPVCNFALFNRFANFKMSYYEQYFIIHPYHRPFLVKNGRG